MIDTFLKLIEWLIKSQQVHQENKEKVFDRYVQPMYDEAEKIYGDYLKLLTDIKRKLKADVDIAAIIEQLEIGRLEYKPARDKLRAALRQLDTEDLPTFERGIVGVLCGGASRLGNARALGFRPYSSASRHTLLDILCRLRDKDTERAKESGLRAVDQQLHYLDKAWQDVVDGYVERQKEVLP